MSTFMEVRSVGGELDWVFLILLVMAHLLTT